jgi:hypothetical protein
MSKTDLFYQDWEPVTKKDIIDAYVEGLAKLCKLKPDDPALAERMRPLYWMPEHPFVPGMVCTDTDSVACVVPHESFYSNPEVMAWVHYHWLSDEEYWQCVEVAKAAIELGRPFHWE